MDVALCRCKYVYRLYLKCILIVILYEHIIHLFVVFYDLLGWSEEF